MTHTTASSPAAAARELRLSRQLLATAEQLFRAWQTRLFVVARTL